MTKGFKIYLFLVLLMTACARDENLPRPDYFGNANQDSLVKSNSETKMVLVPAGSYKPFFGPDTAIAVIAAFYLDETPVTNAQYLEFVKQNPEWRKSQIKRLFADTSYLKDWPSDLQLPVTGKLNSPVSSVSWFAATAYAKSVGKRLPTLDEWEFVAMADEFVPNARSKKEYSAYIVDLYLQKDRQYNVVNLSKPNYYGVNNMFDLVWEWTSDFNSVLTTGDTRNDNEDEKGLFCGGGAASASDLLNYAAFMRFGLRASLQANYTVANLGFRCAKDVKP